MSDTLQTRYLKIVTQLGKDPVGALAGLEALLAEAPDFAAGWNSLGLLRLHVGNAAGAAKAFAQAASHSPESAPIRLNLARAQAAQGKAREAVQNFWQALTLDPQQPEAWRQALAHVRSLKEPQPQRDFFIASLALAQTPAQFEPLGEHLAAYSPKLAAELLKVTLAALQQQNAPLQTWQSLARLAQDSGHEAVAYEAYLQLLKSQPRSLDILAELFRLAPEPEAKRGHLEQAISLSPRDPFLHFSLAKVLIQCQAYDQALSHAQKALQLRPALAPRIAATLFDTSRRLTPFRLYGLHSPEKILISRRFCEAILPFLPPELDYNVKRSLAANLLLPASPDYVYAEALAAELVRRYPVAHTGPLGADSAAGPRDDGHYYELASARFELGHAAGPDELIDFRALDPDAHLPLLELPALEWHRPLSPGEKPVIFQACSSDNFVRKALPQILSLVKLGLPYHYHLHSFSPDARIAPLVEQLAELLPLSWTSEALSHEQADLVKAYTRTARISRLAQLMQEAPATYISLNPSALFLGPLADLLAADQDLALLTYPNAMPFDRYSSVPMLLAPTPASRRLLAMLDSFLRYHPVRHSQWQLEQFGLYCAVRKLGESLRLGELSQAKVLTANPPGSRNEAALWIPAPGQRAGAHPYQRRKAELLQAYGFAKAD